VRSGRCRVGNGKMSRRSSVCGWRIFWQQSCEQPFGVRVGLRIRRACRVRVNDSHVGCEVSERRVYLANVEEATAAGMRYGCQRGEIFEGCEWRCRERHAKGQNLRIRVTRVRNTANPVRYWGAINPELLDAQSVAVVRNHEDGTGLRVVPQARNRGWESLVGRG